MYKTATITYTYGNGLISDSRKEAKGSDADGDLIEDKTAVIRSENLRFLYNGRYGVETGANGLYYMRARYYNPQIKRFINRDIIDGSITDSQSLNKYSYVQGNPISLVDPFGLCAQDYFSRAGHELLDWLGFIFDPADAINFLWYTAEGNAAMAAATAVAIVPAAGSFIAKGTKQAIKAGKKAAQKAGEKAAKNATEKAAKKAAKKKLAKKAGKEAAEKGAEKAAKEAAEKATEKTAKEAAEKGAKGGLDTIIKNGKVSIDDIKTNPSAFSGKSAEEIADVLRNSGYDVTIKNSTRSRSGAQIIQINNSGGGKNISQVQVSPGGGRHGSNPYVKISTTDQGIIKIVDGIEGTYKTDGKETATIIFSGGN